MKNLPYKRVENWRNQPQFFHRVGQFENFRRPIAVTSNLSIPADMHEIGADKTRDSHWRSVKSLTNIITMG